MKTKKELKEIVNDVVSETIGSCLAEIEYPDPNGFLDEMDLDEEERDYVDFEIQKRFRNVKSSLYKILK